MLPRDSEKAVEDVKASVRVSRMKPAVLPFYKTRVDDLRHQRLHGQISEVTTVNGSTERFYLVLLDPCSSWMSLSVVLICTTPSF